MSLSGKISTELPVHATAEKWFHIMTKKLHHIQHVAGKIHGAKLHQGDDWHVNDSVKHWTYTLGKYLYSLFLFIYFTKSKSEKFHHFVHIRSLIEFEVSIYLFSSYFCEKTDGKTVTCLETIESVDEEKKRIAFKLFGEAIDDKYKVFNITFEAIEKDGDSAAIKWSIEYEKVSEEVHAPYGYLELYDHVTRDVDVHLLEGEKVSANKN